MRGDALGRGEGRRREGVRAGGREGRQEGSAGTFECAGLQVCEHNHFPPQKLLFRLVLDQSGDDGTGAVRFAEEYEGREAEGGGIERNHEGGQSGRCARWMQSQELKTPARGSFPSPDAPPPVPLGTFQHTRGQFSPRKARLPPDAGKFPGFFQCESPTARAP